MFCPLCPHRLDQHDEAGCTACDPDPSARYPMVARPCFCLRGRSWEDVTPGATGPEPAPGITQRHTVYERGVLVLDQVYRPQERRWSDAAPTESA